MRRVAALSLALASLATVLGARQQRGAAFNNIISNYFTTDPFFQAKQKARLHLPKSTKSPGLSNAKTDRKSSTPPPAPPRPVRLRLGPPIQLVPTLRPRPPPAPSPGTRRGLGEVVVGVQREVVVPAPLLAAGDTSSRADNREKTGDNRRAAFSQLISTPSEASDGRHAVTQPAQLHLSSADCGYHYLPSADVCRYYYLTSCYVL